MDSPNLYPLAISEILDRAYRLTRANFRSIARAVLPIIIPAQAISFLIRLSFPAELQGNGFNFTSATTNNTSTASSNDLFTFFAGVLVILVLTIVVNMLTTAVCFKILSSSYLGQDTDSSSSREFALKRLPSLLWLSFIQTLLIGLGFLFCIVPGVYLYGAFSVSIPILLLEEKKGTKALERSRNLVKGRWWPTSGVLIVIYFLGSILGLVLTAPLLVVTAATHNHVISALTNSISGVFSQLIVSPFSAAAIILLYVDLRVRKEGFDLQLLADRLGISPSQEGMAFTPQPVLPYSSAPPPPPTVQPTDQQSSGSDQPPFWPPPPGWKPRGQ